MNLKVASTVFGTTKIQGLPYETLKLKSSPIDGQSFKLALIIPGNPGLVRFYESFARSAYAELDGQFNVWVVSHSNFCEEDYEACSTTTSILEREFEHKLLFLEHEVPKDAEVILIGHSIGCYIILNVVSMLIGDKPRSYNTGEEFYKNVDLFDRIKQCHYIFPTIHDMKESPNGKRLSPVFDYLQGVCYGVSYVISKLPMGIRKKFVSLFLPAGVTDMNILESAVSLIVPKFVKSMLSMAEEELKVVCSLDPAPIAKCIDKLTIYYGENDGWCPLSYRDEVLEKVPGVDARTDSHGISHSFVCTESNLMASILCKVIKSKLL